MGRIVAFPRMILHSTGGRLKSGCLKGWTRMNISATIIPIFILIIIGWVVRKRGFITPAFLSQANRLVYLLAIPAMVFRAIYKTDFFTQFNPYILIITLSVILFVFITVWVMGLIFRIHRLMLGSFIHTSIHGNLGYIAFAVAYYFLGNEGLVRTSIIAGFVMILQNLLAVVALQACSESDSSSRGIRQIMITVLGNPIIISAMAGICCSIISIHIPLIIERSLDILSSLALPLALLIIGASLSFKLMRSRLAALFSSSMFKLLLLPALGFALFRVFNQPPRDYLPGLIVLASPSATVTFIMAKEMGGDPDFAVAAISMSTILSAITLSAWLHIAA